MKSLSRITHKLVGQPMFKLMARARTMDHAGRKIIHYEIGDPNFNSPQAAKDALKEALDQNLTHYTESPGLLSFRQAIRHYIETHYGFKPDLEQVMACPTNALIDFVCRCLVNPGEEIILPDPGFPSYYSAINYNGFIPVGVKLQETNEFRLHPKDVEKKITDKTRLIIINSSQNPTGAVMTASETEQIYQIAENYDLYLLSDEVYSRIIYDVTFHSPSLFDRCRKRTILIKSLSKVYAMTGWRLGYAVAPPDLIEKLYLLLQTILSCLPAFTQIGGSAALNSSPEYFQNNMKILRQRRDTLIPALNALKGMSCIMPQGAFYAFPNIRATGLSSTEYCQRLLEEQGVCALPGNCFGSQGEGYIRLSYGSVTLDQIHQSLQKMARFHDSLKIPSTPSKLPGV
ncbi:MAG: hypothetical protein AMJ79_02950 [Phycisphaerae bacterium SM23_30]|nr:MAG: hypothetical protein AMJ79_02950 [Phycisphaerae bacterium SM23_30]